LPAVTKSKIWALGPVGEITAETNTLVSIDDPDHLVGVYPTHWEVLRLDLERLKLLDERIQALDKLAAQELKKHEGAVMRLASIPGLGVDSAPQIIAEVGADAGTFPSAGQLCSWVGVCPGRNESAEENQSSRSPKGNRFLRRILTQAAQAAVKKKGCHFQAIFRRLLPRLGYNGAIWAIAHRLCRLIWKVLHQEVSYIEQGAETTPKAKKRRAQKLAQALRKMGYAVTLTAMPPDLLVEEGQA